MITGESACPVSGLLR